MNTVIHSLSRLRRRSVGQFFIERLATCSLVFAAFVVAIAAINTIRGITPLDKWFGVIGFCGALVSAIAWTLMKIPSLEQMAMRIDGIAGTRDRFLTACHFLKVETRTDFQEIALRECNQFIGAFDVKRYSGFRFPHRAPWLLVPLAALTLLEWNATLARKAGDAGAGGNPVVAREARQLEKIAQTIDASKTASDDLKKIAEEIRKGEKRMQGEKSGDARKTALQEMSSLEEMIQEMLKPKNNLTPDEAAVLAAVLRQSELTKDAAAALESGKAEEAADKLERLLQQKDSPQLDKAGRDIQQAMTHLTPDQKGEAGKELEQAQTGTQALQRLAENLRKAGNSPQVQNGSNSDSNAAMKKILSDLQNMKYGADPGEGSQGEMADDSKPGKDGSGILMQSPGSGTPQTQQMAATDIPSGGMPGSEHDTGTTKNPYGAQQKQSEIPPVASRVGGVNGAGTSLHDFISATGDTSRATRSYRDLYNFMLPAAEEAVVQENIPPGSRFYIKRYFQSIRPKQ